MVWYNPLSWFGDRQELDSKTKLICDNPQCRAIIEGAEVAYNAEQREVYHDGECAQFTNAHRAFNSGVMQISNVNYIGLNEALKLFRQGKLNQSKRLEERV